MSEEFFNNHKDLESLAKALRARAVEQARSSFLSYVLLMAPHLIPDNFVMGKHIEKIIEALEKVDRGEINRLQIWMPPRSMKSLLGNILFPSWFMGRRPTQQVMCISYGRELAVDFSRQVRNILLTEDYQEIFPGVELRADSRAAHKWHLTDGGVYTTGGITTGIAGKGADLAIIDDPLSEQDAYSQAARDYVKKWYPSGLRSRLSPSGKIILISTRWNLDDLPGWLLSKQGEDPRSDKWHVLEIPAIIENEKHVKMVGQPVGSSYWPERWPLENLLATKAELPPGAWQALYMQRPMAEEGGILKKEWFQKWNETKPPQCKHIVMSVDTAFATTDRSDFSCLSMWGIFYKDEQVLNKSEMSVPHLILLSCIKGRWEFHELRELAVDMVKDWKPDNIIIEKKASGQSLIQELRRANIPIIPYKPDKDKISRAYACQPVLEKGRVWLPMTKKWAYDFLDEVSSFPHAAHDDQVDTFTQVIAWMRDWWHLVAPGDAFWGWEPSPPKRVKSLWD